MYSLHVPVEIVRHPIAQDALLALRDRGTPSARFRVLAHRVSLVLAVAATADLPTTVGRVETPLEPADGTRIHERVVIVPVLRAGLGMVNAMLEVLPDAAVGHVGLVRDEETAIASRYYAKLPPIHDDTQVLLVDPMLATGGSAIEALRFLEAAGCRHIRLVAIVSAPEGISAVEEACPSVRIFTTAVDRQLNAKKYILPGLGDFGDRLYGT